MILSAEERIRQSEPGSMIWSIAQLDAGAREVALFVREEDEYLAKLGPTPTVELRFAVFAEEHAAPCVVMLRHSADMLYESWINVHADGGADALQLLCTQFRLPILWFGDKQKRTIAIANRLQRACANAAVVVAEVAPWSMRSFEDARNRIYARYPSPAKLWRGAFEGRES